MIVLDASALLEFLLQTPLGTRVEARLFRDGDEFHSPDLVDVEVARPPTPRPDRRGVT